MIGQSFQQVQITASLGASGMGEVFRARDTRLDRLVPSKASFGQELVCQKQRAREMRLNGEVAIELLGKAFAALGPMKQRDLAIDSCSHLNAPFARVPLCKRSSGNSSRTRPAKARMSNTTDRYPRKNALKSSWT
jgi:hypothetical protein